MLHIVVQGGFASLALGAGSTVYLNGDATGVDALPATVTTIATSESKANIVIDFSAIPATGASFTLFPAVSADVFNVQPMFGSLVLPNEVAVVNARQFPPAQGRGFWYNTCRWKT